MSCKYFERKICQNCELIDLPYIEQINQKKEHFDELWGDKNSTIIKASNHMFSRARAKMAIGGTSDYPIIGFVSNKEVIDNIECPLHFKIITNTLKEIRQLITKYNLVPYNIFDRKGELKYLIVSSNSTEDELMVRFVLRSKEARERVIKAYQELKVLIPQIKVCSINYNPDHTSIIEGDIEEILSYDKYINQSYNSLNFKIGVKSFFQITPDVAEKLYFKAAKSVLNGDQLNVLDLYCGVGGFALHIASMSNHRVQGREISEEAVIAASINMENQNVNDCIFSCVNADNIDNLTGIDILILNPPRRGISNELINAIKSSQVKQIIYSSCGPDIQFQNIKELGDKFVVTSRIAFDMFPNTSHYESLVILSAI